MNLRKLFIVVLVLGIALFTFSGCTAVLLVLGAGYLLGEPTEPTEPTIPDITDPKPNSFHSVIPIT